MICSECSNELRPVVAFDLDNTLGDWTSGFLEFLSQWLPMEDSTHLKLDVRMWDWAEYDGAMEFSDYLRITKAAYREAKLAYRAGGYKRWMPHWPNESVSHLSLVAERLDCEVWITTTRPWMRLDNIDLDTKEWLRRASFEYDFILYDPNKYEELLERVDRNRVVMVLEDQADKYEAAYALGLPVVLRKSKWNRAIERPNEVATLGKAASLLEFRVEQWRKKYG